MALGAAALFGLSTPVAKLLLAQHRSLAPGGRSLPWLRRRVLLCFASPGGCCRPGVPARPGLLEADWPWLLGAIFFGGVLGPILLLTGLSLTAATTTSLLLNLESVFTALIAWFVFREGVDRRIALGMAAIALGADGSDLARLGRGPAGGGVASFRGLLGPLAIAGACLAWALDNNLTRRVSLLDPTLIAMLKRSRRQDHANLALAFALAPFFGAGPSAGSLVAGSIIRRDPRRQPVRHAELWRQPRPLRPRAARRGRRSAHRRLLRRRTLHRRDPRRRGPWASRSPLSSCWPAPWMLAGLWLHLTERHVHEHEHMLPHP